MHTYKFSKKGGGLMHCCWAGLAGRQHAAAAPRQRQLLRAALRCARRRRAAHRVQRPQPRLRSASLQASSSEEDGREERRSPRAAPSFQRFHRCWLIEGSIESGL